MKRFLIRILLFVLPILGVLAAWELLMHSFPHVFKYKRTVIMEKCRKNGEALFLGSSHTYYGVNSDVLPNAYNLGFVSQKLIQDRLILEQFLSKPVKLKYLLIPVSTFSLFKSKINLEDWRTVDYVRYWNFPAKKITDHLFILDNVPYQLKYLRKTSKKIRKKGLNEALSCSATGWGNDYFKAEDYSLFEQQGKSSAARHASVDLDDISSFYDLKAMIGMAKKHNIKVILFTPPGHPTYYNNIPPIQENKMRALLSEVINDKDVFYIDLLRSQDFKNEDFFDPDHMSHIGAEKLARILYEFYKSK